MFLVLAQLPPVPFGWLPQALGVSVLGVVVALGWRYIDAKDKANDRRHRSSEARLTGLADDGRKSREELGDLRTDHAVELGRLDERVGHLERNTNPFATPSRPPKASGDGT